MQPCPGADSAKYPELRGFDGLRPLFPRLGERTLSGFGVRRPGGFSPESGEGVINGVRIVDAMIQGANPNVSDADSEQIERSACPTCGS